MKLKDWEPYKDLEFYPDRICPECLGLIKIKEWHRYWGFPKYCSKKCSTKKTQFKKGHKIGGGWNRGLTKETDSRVASQAQKITGKLRGSLPETTKRKLRKSNLGKSRSEKTKNNNKKAAIKMWQDPEFISKQMQARGCFPNKTEKFLNKILQKLFPNQFNYVGDGKDKNYIIGGKCPDFIHTVKPLIMELFGDYWHGEERNGISNQEHEQERIQLFESEGYKTLIIWEHELNEIDKLVGKINCFMEKNSCLIIY